MRRGCPWGRSRRIIAFGNVHQPEEAVVPRGSKLAPWLATVLGVTEEQLPEKLRQLKGERSYEALAKELAGRGVQVDQSWLWRYLNPAKALEGREREREARRGA
jgi:hypothetical protein